MRRMLIAAAALAGAIALPTAAMARPGFVTSSLPLHAGPSPDFPVVDRIPAGAQVDIHGCIAGFAWCDVAFAGDRGWVDGDHLQLLYGGHRVLIVDYGPRIGFPIVSFAVGDYWRTHYRGRNFFGRLGYWEQHYTARGGPGRTGTVGRGSALQRGVNGRRGPETSGAAPGGTRGTMERRGAPETSGAAPRGTMERRGRATTGTSPRGTMERRGAPGTTGATPRGAAERQGPAATGAAPRGATTGAGPGGGAPHVRGGGGHGGAGAGGGAPGGGPAGGAAPGGGGGQQQQ